MNKNFSYNKAYYFLLTNMFKLFKSINFMRFGKLGKLVLAYQSYQTLKKQFAPKKSEHINLKFMLKKFSHLIAFGFGSGLIKPMPGTWGTLFALLIVSLIQALFPTMQAQILLSIIMPGLLIGTWAVMRTQTRLFELGEQTKQSTNLDALNQAPPNLRDALLKMQQSKPKTSDHGQIVIDEIVAFLLLAYLNNIWQMQASLLTLFIWFRIFDILKPYPIGYIDKYFKQYKPNHMLNALGVMLDDLLAIIYVLLIVKFF